MTTFALVADTASGVQKVDLIDFLADNPDQEFIPAQEYIGYLRDLADCETVAAIFDPLVHHCYLSEIEDEYGIK